MTQAEAQKELQRIADHLKRHFPDIEWMEVTFANGLKLQFSDN